MKQHSHLCAPETSAAVVKYRSTVPWRVAAVGLGYPAAYAPTLCAIAHGKPGQVTPEGEQELRRRLGLPYDVRHIVDVPADHDAAVHLLPAGNGTLHTYTVPADAEVVIVPAGTRVVQSAPARPKRERTRLDVTRYVRAGWQPDEIRDIADALEPYAGRLSALDVRIWLDRLMGLARSD